MKSSDLWSKRSVWVAFALTSVFGAWAYGRVSAQFDNIGLNEEWSNAARGFALVSLISGGSAVLLTWRKSEWLRKTGWLFAYQSIVAFLIVIILMVDAGPDQLKHGFPLWLTSSFVWASGFLWSFLAILLIRLQFAAWVGAKNQHLGVKR